MFRKFLFLACVSAFVLSLIHCSKEQKTPPKEEEVSLNEVKDSMEVADREIVKMIDQMSDMGFQNKKQMTTLLKSFSESDDKFEKYKLCSPILLAKVSYQLRAQVNKDVPQLTDSQLKTIEDAENHCKWSAQTINEFEENLTDEDLKIIAGDVENSLVPLRKTIFSNVKKCTMEEYKKLLKVNRDLYSDTKVLGAVLVMIAMQTEDNIKQYIPNYMKVVVAKNPDEKDFLLKFLENAKDSSTNQARQLEQKKQSLARATKAFSDAGVKNIPQFLIQSVKTAPQCFSSVRSGVVDLAKTVTTADRMQQLYTRLKSEVQKSGKLPIDGNVEAAPQLKNLETQFLQKLVDEKIATRDKWFRPLMIKGDEANFNIVSSGKDRQAGSKDDLIYPKK